MPGKDEIVAGIRLDGEQEFKNDVTAVNKSISAMKSELGKVTAECDGQANSLESLSKKQEVLNKILEEQKKKVEATKAGLDNANESYANIGHGLDALYIKQEKEINKLKEIENIYGSSSDEAAEQQQEVDKLSAAISYGTQNYEKAGNRVKDWETRLNTAETQVISATKAVNKNAAYMKEAENSTDHCAKSIDEFGKQVKEVKVSTETFADSLKANIVSGVAGKAFDIVADGAKKAAEYTVEAGSSFEAAMSEVGAISGASSDQMEKMSQKAKQLGASTKFSATEAAGAFKYMSLAGWSTSDMLSGIDGVMQLAAASGMDLAQASDMVTDYLSAFGLQASDSAMMADMLAFAQANSNTTAEQLGEAYKNCAANMNAAGQDIWTTTSLLEAMANQGIKGSEAGTQVSAIMRDITAKMKDGCIAIGETSVAVTDANGNYRDMTDIMQGVKKATDGMGNADKNAALSATFTADSLKGLNLILNEGVDKVAGYEDALRDCEGAAGKMADTMSDNLKGDITEAGSALEGLGIAAYGYIEGPLRSVTQGVTDVINGITDAITPQKTELQTFVDEIKASNEEVSGLIQNAQDTMTGAQTDVSELDAYKQMILSVNEVEQKSEFQKYQMKTAVEKLSGSIPQLASAFDEETGSIKLTKEEIDGLFESQKNLILQQAGLKAQEDTYKALYTATLNQEKAASAAAEAKKKLDDFESKENFKELIGINDELLDQYTELQKTYKDAVKTQEESAKALEKAQKEYDSTAEVTGITNEKMKELGETQKETAETTNDSGDANEEFAQSQKEVAKAAQELTESLSESDAAAEAQKTAMDQIVQAYDETKSEIESRLQDKISLFDMFDKEDGGEDMTVEKMTENLNSQIDAFKEYQDNLEAVKDHVGKEITPEFMQYLESMGMDGANTLKHIIATFEDEEPEKVREMCDKWTEAMDETENIAKVGAANQTAYEMAMGKMGSTEADFSELEKSIDKAAADAGEGWKELPKATETALTQAVQTAKEYGIQIPEGLTEGIASGEISAEEAVAQLNGTVEGTLQGLLQMANESGLEIPKEIKNGINAGGQETLDAYKALIELLSGQKTEAEKAGNETGEAGGSGVGTGLDSKQGEVEKAGGNLGQAGANAVKDKSSEFQSAGKIAAIAVSSGLASGFGGVTSSAASLASGALNQINGQYSGFYSAGENMAAGVARGIYAGTSVVITATEHMARESLKAAKRESEIHSPSRKFRKEVGQEISKGMALGIKDKASLAGDEAARMSLKVYTRATNWMKRYKKSHEVTLADEVYFWRQVQKHTKEGTSAYNKALKKVDALTGGTGSATLIGKIKDNFGVSKTTTTGSGDNKKTVNKDSKTFNSEVLSAAEQYLKNYQLLYKMSEKQELAYWQNVKKNLKKGTQAWYDATAKIQDAKERIRQSKQDEIAERASVQDSILDKYKVYYKVSAKAEADYWNTARKQFKAGTDERIEADHKYFEALQNYYDERKELDEDYAENHKKIDDELIEKTKELQDAYTDAVNSRKNDILSQMDLFESWDSSGYDADTLMYNLKTQVAGLAFWEEQLEELGKKNISTDLLEELKKMGPEAAASIYSLNQMTAEQLEEYEKLWQQKNDLAQSQAVKDNAGLLDETNKQIKELRLDAQAELNALNADYRAAVAELEKGMSQGLENLVKKAGDIGEESVSKLVSNIKAKTDSVDTYKSTTEVVKKITNQLGELENQGKVIGKNTLQNILMGLTQADIQVGRQQESLQKQLEGLNFAGVAKINDALTGNVQQVPTVNVDLSGITEAIEQMRKSNITLVDAISGMRVVLDTDETVGRLQPEFSRENASAAIRRNRGRLR